MRTESTLTTTRTGKNAAARRMGGRSSGRTSGIRTVWTTPTGCIETGGGGGGPDPVRSLTELLSDSKNRVRKDLAKGPCAGDFKNIDAVLNKLDNIGFSNQGQGKFHTENGVPVADKRSPGD